MTTAVAIVILTDISHDKAAVYRGLDTAREFADAGDDVTIVFDGSGTESLAALTADDHALHPLLERLRERVRGACGYCAKAHKVADPLIAAGFPLLTENHGHASIRSLVVEGRQVLTF